MHTFVLLALRRIFFDDFERRFNSSLLAFIIALVAFLNSSYYEFVTRVTGEEQFFSLPALSF